MTDTDKVIDELDKIKNEYKGVDKERIEMLYTKATNTTSSMKDVSVQSTPKAHSREDILIMLAELSKGYDECISKLKEVYRKAESRNLKIYIEKKYFNFSNDQLELKWGLSKRHINRICKKIEKNR